jgi:hypothetical protein
MSEAGFYMSSKEVDRLLVIKDLCSGKMNQKEAGRLLGITDRQIRRLVKTYITKGKAGLVSKKHGKVSNNRISDRERETMMFLVSGHYYDFGPTLACEKLRELHGLSVSKETLRKWMIEDGIWEPRKKKRGGHQHQMRERRSIFGELVQIDGSPHDWFEGRREPCTLIVFIDDATGEYMELRFYEAETTEAYMETMRVYVDDFGIPRTLYHDKHGIFRINQQDTNRGNDFTQFGRAMKELDVEMIYANSPQAKGRVERANGTLQDRLVKEMRLKGINTIEEANEFLREYRHELNDKFAVKAKSPENAHRPVNHSKDELELIFSLKTERTISKNLELSYKNTVYQILVEGRGLSMRKAKAVICEDFKGSVKILYKGREMKYKTFIKPQKQFEEKSPKTLNKFVTEVIKEQNERNKTEKEKVLQWKLNFKENSFEQNRTF